MTLWPLWVALGVGVLLFLVGLRQPLVARLGARNAWRHRRQTAIVVAGLLTGTAVIGASLIAGDSLEGGLRNTAIDAVDEMDVLISVPGNLYFSESLAEAVLAPELPARVDGTSALVIEGAAFENGRTDLYEPDAVVMGMDWDEERPFGSFVDAATGERVDGTDLGDGELYLNARLARALDAEPGDEVVLTYRLPFLPVIPDLTWANGTLVAASAVPDQGGGYAYAHAPNDVFEHTFEVPVGAEGVMALVAWFDAANTTDLDLELVAPSGQVFLRDNGTLVSAPVVPGPVPVPVPVPEQPGVVEDADNPAVLVLPREDAEPGTWTLRVHGKNAQNQPYFGFAASLVPEYDLERALAFYEGFEGDFGGGLGGLQPDLDDRLAGENATFRVARVVAMTGKAVFFDADVAFMSRSVAQGMYGMEGRVNWLKVTHAGDAEAGLAGTDETVSFFEDRIRDIALADGEDPSAAPENLVVQPLKQEFVAQTEEAATIFTQFLTLIGSFTLIAGIMLIVNIFSMLAEERRHELGIARAVGLTRGKLMLAFTFEGSLYTLAASALGVLVGMGLAAFLVWGINSLAPPETLFSVPYTVRFESLALAFAVGSLITFVTVAGASWRAGRVNIVRAIRDLDDPQGGEGGRLWPRLLFFGVVVGAASVGIALGSFTALALGPALAALAFGPLLGRLWHPRLAWRFLSLGVIGYTLLSFVLFHDGGSLEGDVATVLRGLLLVIAATVFLVELDAAPRGVAWLLRRFKATAAIATVATTYPLHRRFRTGLTLSMYALVLLVIVLFSVFFTIFTPDPAQQTGGYDIVADSQVPVDDLRAVDGIAALAGTPDDPFLGIERVDVLVEHFEFGDERIFIEGNRLDGFTGPGAQFYGFEMGFAENNGFRLDEWDPQYGATERDVWRTVAASTNLVMVSHALVANLTEEDGKRYHSGAVLTVNRTGGQDDFVIAGIMEQHWFGGVWLPRAELETLFAEMEGFFLARTDPGVDAEEAAMRMERAFRVIGMDANDVDSEAAQIQQETTRVYQLFQAYLALGLIVGVASIGIMTARAVLERRREIGMLKAIGFTRRQVAAAFLAEVLFVLFTASVIGIGMGLAIARAIYVGQLSVFPGVEWTIPWWRILQMLGIALIATVLATLAPARRASKVPAAEALRTLE